MTPIRVEPLSGLSRKAAAPADWQRSRSPVVGRDHNDRNPDANPRQLALQVEAGQFRHVQVGDQAVRLAGPERGEKVARRAIGLGGE